MLSQTQPSQKPDNFSSGEKRFVSGLQPDKRFGKLTKPKVTIAIGILHNAPDISERQIVFAADSQRTYLSGPKDLDAEKIRMVQFANCQVLLAYSGFEKPCQDFVRIIQRRAKGFWVENQESVANVAMESLRELRLPIYQQIRELNLTEDKINNYIRLENDCAFILGFFYKGTPGMLTLDINSYQVTESEFGDYAAIGIGDSLAKYIIKEFKCADRDFVFSEEIAIATIEKVKGNTDKCGGPTRVGIVFPALDEPGCAVHIFEQWMIDRCALEIKRQEEKSLPEKRERMLEGIKNIWGNYYGPDVVEHLRKKFKP
jgi:hypothetical protein